MKFCSCREKTEKGQGGIIPPPQLQPTIVQLFGNLYVNTEYLGLGSFLLIVYFT